MLSQKTRAKKNATQDSNKYALRKASQTLDSQSTDYDAYESFDEETDDIPQQNASFESRMEKKIEGKLDSVVESIGHKMQEAFNKQLESLTTKLE